MINIQKLKDGRKISLAEYNQAKSEYEQVYANADDDTKAKMDGLMRSSQNYSSADPMNNISSREYETQMYKNAVKVANGEYTEALGAVASTKNIFNGYSHDENINNANYVTSKYLNQGKKSSTSAPASGSTSSGQSFYNFKWADGLTSSYGLDTDTFQDRYGRFIDNLIKNVNNAISAKQSGKVVRGLAQQDSDQLEAILQGLVDLKQKSSGLQQNDALKELLKFAGPLKIDENGFKSYFSSYLPQQSAAEQTKQGLLNQGWQFNLTSTGNAKLDSKGYHIGTKDRKNYLYDDNYQLITNPDAWMDDDSTSATKGNGYIIGEDGRYWVGDFTTATESNPYYQQIKKYLQDSKLAASNKYHIYRNWSDINYDSEDQFIKNLKSQYGTNLNGKNVVDVSSYYGTNTPVFAAFNDDPNFHIDSFGHLDLSNSGAQLYYIDPTTKQIVSTSYADSIPLLGNQNRKADNRKIQISNYDLDLDALTDVYDLSNNWDGGTWTQSLRVEKYGNTRIPHIDNIEDHPTEWVQAMLEFIGSDDSQLTPEQRQMKRRFYSPGNELKLLATIWGIMKTNPGIQLNESQRNGWRQLLQRGSSIMRAQRSQSSQVQSQKEGGIVKAAEGVTLGMYRQENPIYGTSARMRQISENKRAKEEQIFDRAAARGVNVDTQAASERGWTSSDTLRAAALAQDIAGTIAALSGAFTGGAGSLAAEVTGFTSMGTDLLADITDNSVTVGETLKNASINTGFALTSFIPGSKLGKLGKGVLKILPHAITAIAAANVALSPEIHASVEKLTKAGAAGSSKLTTKDWQNIMIVLRTASGIGRSTAGIKNARTNRQRLEKVQSEVNPNEVTVKIKDSEVRMTKEDADNIDAGLKKGATDAAKQKANEILARVKPGETIESISTKRTPSNWKERITFKGNRVLERLDPKITTDSEKLATELANEEAAFRAKTQSSGWQKAMTKMDRVASRFKPGIKSGSTYSPFQLQAMRTYKTVGEEHSGSTSKVREKLQIQADNEAKLKEQSKPKSSHNRTSTDIKTEISGLESRVKDLKNSRNPKKDHVEKAYEEALGFRDELTELARKGDNEANQELTKLNKIIADLESRKLVKFLKSSKKQFGGKIDSKYSHLRK